MNPVHNGGDSVTAARPEAPVERRRADSPKLWTGAWREVARAARGIHWYLTTLMGDNAYATYVAHQRRHHPNAAVPTEREFWRQRMDDQDRNPGARCC